MARLVVKDNITAGAGFRPNSSARWFSYDRLFGHRFDNDLSSRQSNLHVSSEFAERLDPIELSSVNELLDRIAALGVTTDYDQIGHKTDLREIYSPQATHHVAVVEEQRGDSSCMLKTN